jgi:glutamyl-tRNA synthetase
MIAAFDIHDVNKAASAFNPEKLLWLNQQHMVRKPPSEIVPHLQYQLGRLGLRCDDTAMLEGLIVAQRERAKTLKEMAQNSRFFFTDDIEFDAKAVAKNLTAESAEGLRETLRRLTALSEWSAPNIHEALNGLATERGVGLGKIVQPVRVAISGGTVSPPIDATLALLGKERTLKRIESALSRI